MNEYADHKVHNLADCVAKYYIDAYDELNGAKTYIMEALDLNRTNRKMADRRQMRSFDELNHAAGIMEDVISIHAPRAGCDLHGGRIAAAVGVKKLGKTAIFLFQFVERGTVGKVFHGVSSLACVLVFTPAHRRAVGWVIILFCSFQCYILS